jgi:hypothetical protein
MDRRLVRGAVLAAIIACSAACSSSNHQSAKPPTTPTTARGGPHAAPLPAKTAVNVDYASLPAWCHRVHSLYAARDTTSSSDLKDAVRTLLEHGAAIEYRGKITTPKQAASELAVVNETCTTLGR